MNTPHHIKTIRFTARLVEEYSAVPTVTDLGTMEHQMELQTWGEPKEATSGRIIWNWGRTSPDSGEEVIGLQFLGRKVTDYDGVFSLPKEAESLLKSAWYDLSELEVEPEVEELVQHTLQATMKAMGSPDGNPLGEVCLFDTNGMFVGFGLDLKGFGSTKPCMTLEEVKEMLRRITSAPVNTVSELEAFLARLDSSFETEWKIMRKAKEDGLENRRKLFLHSASFTRYVRRLVRRAISMMKPPLPKLEPWGVFHGLRVFLSVEEPKFVMILDLEENGFHPINYWGEADSVSRWVGSCIRNREELEAGIEADKIRVIREFGIDKAREFGLCSQ